MLKQFKEVVATLPLVGPVLRWMYKTLFGREILTFRRSDQYWEDRYTVGGTSGSGSYGQLAQFKAEFLNNFVSENDISSVVEFGCGDGAQLALANYPYYVGFDVAPTSIRICQEKFSSKPNFSFHLVGSKTFENLEPSDLVLSLDVIFHLVEDDVFESYMKTLFESANRFVIIYAYDFEMEYAAKHEKGRNFTKWIRDNAPGWRLIERTQNRYPYDPSNPTNTSQSDFFVYKKED